MQGLSATYRVIGDPQLSIIDSDRRTFAVMKTWSLTYTQQSSKDDGFVKKLASVGQVNDLDYTNARFKLEDLGNNLTCEVKLGLRIHYQ